MSQNMRIWAGMFTIYLVWGSTYLAIRFAVGSIPPFFMAGMRFLIAGLILFTWRRLAGDPLPAAAQWRGAGAVGLFLLLGGNGLVSWAEQRVPSGVAALLIGATPFWIALVDALRPNGKRPNWKIIAGLLTGFAGISLLIQSSQHASPAERVYLPGALALILAALSWAMGTVYGSQATMPKSPFMATGVEMLVGGPALLVASGLTGEWQRLDLSAITLQSWLSWTYLVLLGSVVVLSVYTWLVRNAPLSLVSTYAYVNPLVAIFLGYLLAKETLNWQILLSAGVIISAVALINVGRLTQPPTRLAVSTSSD